MSSKTRYLPRIVALAFLIPALAVLAVVSTAPYAGALNGTAQVDVQYGNNACGGVIMGAPVIGSTRFLRSGDQLQFRYVMTNGDDNTAYSVHLYDGDTCTSFGKVGSFTTDGAGAGRTVSRTVNVAGHDRFYAVAIDVSNYVGIAHGSYAVDLP